MKNIFIRTSVYLFFAICFNFILFAKAEAQNIETNKTNDNYSLFNPTPNEKLRDLSPDRPDATESPVTVDAGHYVVEMSVFDIRRNNSDDSLTFLATNFKIGLSANSDLQLVFDAYTFDEPSEQKSIEGFGDVQLRLKYNLWGNDEGNSAFALFPFIKIPTGTKLSNNEFEGGLILPFSYAISDKISSGLMAEIDIVYDDDSQKHKVEFLHSAVVGLDLVYDFGAFVEYIGILGEKDYQVYTAFGLTYEINQNLVVLNK